MKGYKVVEVNKSSKTKFDSFSNGLLGIKFYYKIGIPTNQRNNYGPLAIFGLKSDATRFIKVHGNRLLLFRCEYIPSKEDVLYVPIRFYETETSYSDIAFYSWGKSTKFASSVTLLKQIKV